ncbi:MAG: sodium:solute symporter family protein [Myxococcota bacterium]|nr:sodium:solute symporter family protein [Myxococcota bacterium]
MTQLAWLDWSIVFAYIAVSIGMGLWLRSRASQGIESYFVAGRNMPGWLIGTSMVATTFAADTPLAVTGIVAKHGIAGNWFWWSLAFSHIMAAFVFARLWRRATIVTDAEFIELRYSGQAATTLRLLRAFFFAIPINCIIMGWVIRAMGKIVSVLFPWDVWLGPAVYQPLVDAWPSWVAIRSPSEAISIVLGMIIATLYAAIGGLPTVILTDVIQFTLAMIGSIMLAVYAVDSVGGLDTLVTKMNATYGATANDILSFVPSADSAWLPLEIFLVYILVQWWAQKFSDGGGILIQRMSAAKDEHHALRGTSWFVLAHYALRPWPWILVGLVALIIFPLSDKADPAMLSLADHPMRDIVASDPEMAYPILMAELLPTGLLGIMVTGMVAAFMSTIDTHITWGASYAVKDIYQRFLHPDATEQELVRASRWAMVGMVVLALAATTQIHTIEGAWRFITVVGSGLGLVSIARWFWWRINAESEIAGMCSAALVSLIIYLTPLGSGVSALPYQYILLIVVGISTLSIVVTMLLTQPTDLETLRSFYARVRPPGVWHPVSDGHSDRQALNRHLVSWAIASASLFGILFGLGEWMLGSSGIGLSGLIAGSLGWLAALKLAGALSRN